MQGGRILSLAVAGLAAAGPALAAEQWKPVERDPSVQEVPFDDKLFKADPEYSVTYDPEAQIEIYGGKKPVPNAKPPIEIGRGLYDPGEIGDGIEWLGSGKNRLFPAFSVFGDLRTAVAFNDNGANEVAVIAATANLGSAAGRSCGCTRRRPSPRPARDERRSAGCPPALPPR